MVWILKSAVEPCIWSSERSPLIWSRPTSLSPPALSPEYQSQQFKQKKECSFKINSTVQFETGPNLSQQIKGCLPFDGNDFTHFLAAVNWPTLAMYTKFRRLLYDAGEHHVAWTTTDVKTSWQAISSKIKSSLSHVALMELISKEKTHSTMWLCQNTPSKQSFATTVCFGYTTPKCLKMLLHIWCDWWMMFSMHWVSWKRWQQIATCDKNVFTELITASVDDYNQHSSHGPVAHSQMADKHGLNWQLDKIWYNMIKYMIQYDTIGTSWVWPYWIYSRLDTAAVR